MDSTTTFLRKLKFYYFRRSNLKDQKSPLYNQFEVYLLKLSKVCDIVKLYLLLIYIHCKLKLI